LYISEDTELLVELSHLSRKLDYQLIDINSFLDKIQLKSRGAKDFLIKPWSKDSLELLIAKYLT